MSPLSTPLLVVAPQLHEVLPLEPKVLAQATTEAPSQENTSLPSPHQTSHPI